jgi:hypothetical protein
MDYVLVMMDLMVKLVKFLNAKIIVVIKDIAIEGNADVFMVFMEMIVQKNLKNKIN